MPVVIHDLNVKKNCRTLDSARAVVNELQDHKWIDEYTRAVFVEFLLYNPTVNLFAVSMLNFEFTPIGGA